MNKKIVGVVGLLMLVSSLAMAQEECFSETPAMSALSGLALDAKVSAPDATVTVPDTSLNRVSIALDITIDSAIEQARKDNNKVLEAALVNFKKYAPVQDKFEFVYMPEGFKMHDFSPQSKGMCRRVCQWVTSLVCETVCKKCKPDCHNQLVEACRYIKD
jgi:hypothetical protein